MPFTVKDLFDPLILGRIKETIKNTVVQLFKKLALSSSSMSIFDLSQD